MKKETISINIHIVSIVRPSENIFILFYFPYKQWNMITYIAYKPWEPVAAPTKCYNYK